MPQKILIVRLSSLGDIVQCLTAARALKNLYPTCQIDWLVRSDFAGLLAEQSGLNHVIPIHRDKGFWGFLKQVHELTKRDYDLIYDAHRSLRSWFVRALFRTLKIGRARLVSRNKDRLDRFLQFKLGWRRFKMPYQGSASFLWPLQHAGIQVTTPLPPIFQLNEERLNRAQKYLEDLKVPSRFIVLVPSAAWALKRWPESHFIELIELMKKETFVILGGPEDTFCENLRQRSPTRVFNLAGQLGILDSAAVLAHSAMVIANDTGLMHIADQMGKPTLALIGPSAFGYPLHAQSEALEIELSCKPCSKDGSNRCRNSVNQRCLIELSPKVVATRADRILSAHVEGES